MIPESQYDGGSQIISSSPATPSLNRDTFGIIPLTIKQISEASHSGDDKTNFSVSGSDVVNVTIVGMVSNIVLKNTHTSFTLDDGTAKLECKRWLNEPYDTLQMQQITEGIYVHVDGHLKSFKGQRHVDIFSVRPVTNYDEITFHFIACIHKHMSTSQTVQKIEGDENATQTTPVQNKTNGLTKSAPSSQQSIPFDSNGLPGNDKIVYSYLMREENLCIEKGIHVDELSKNLNLPLNKIMNSIKTLSTEGMIYPTVDDNHYKGA